MADWFTIDKNSGSGDGIVTITASSNTELMEKIAKLRVTTLNGRTKDVSVREKAFNILPSSLIFPSKNADTQVLHIYSSNNWTITKPDWVLVSVESGRGDASISISVENNTDEYREGTITFTTSNGMTRTISVSQAEMEHHTISVSPDMLEFDYKGGEFVLNVVTDYEWIAVPPTGVTLSQYSGVGNATIRGTKSKNSTEDLYSGVIVFSTDTDSTSVMIAQSAKPSPEDIWIEITPSSGTFTEMGGTIDITMRTNAEDWSALQPSFGDFGAIRVYRDIDNNLVGHFYLDVEENLGPARSSYVTLYALVDGEEVQSATFNFSQAEREKPSPSDIWIEVTPSSSSFKKEGGTIDFTVRTNAENWRITTPSSSFGNLVTNRIYRDSDDILIGEFTLSVDEISSSLDERESYILFNALIDDEVVGIAKFKYYQCSLYGAMFLEDEIYFEGMCPQGKDIEYEAIINQIPFEYQYYSAWFSVANEDGRLSINRKNVTHSSITYEGSGEPYEVYTNTLIGTFRFYDETHPYPEGLVIEKSIPVRIVANPKIVFETKEWEFDNVHRTEQFWLNFGCMPEDKWENIHYEYPSWCTLERYGIGINVTAIGDEFEEQDGYIDAYYLDKKMDSFHITFKPYYKTIFSYTTTDGQPIVTESEEKVTRVWEENGRFYVETWSNREVKGLYEGSFLRDKPTLKTIRFEDNVMAIGSRSFLNDENLESVEFGINFNAFTQSTIAPHNGDNCPKLTELHFNSARPEGFLYGGWGINLNNEANGIIYFPYQYYDTFVMEGYEGDFGKTGIQSVWITQYAPTFNIEYVGTDGDANFASVAGFGLVEENGNGIVKVRRDYAYDTNDFYITSVLREYIPDDDVKEITFPENVVHFGGFAKRDNLEVITTSERAVIVGDNNNIDGGIRDLPSLRRFNSDVDGVLKYPDATEIPPYTAYCPLIHTIKYGRNCKQLITFNYDGYPSYRQFFNMNIYDVWFTSETMPLYSTYPNRSSWDALWGPCTGASGVVHFPNNDVSYLNFGGLLTSNRQGWHYQIEE